MELKTKIHSEENRQDLFITREFDLPVELLFKAHVEPDIFAQWMSHEYGTAKVLALENKKYGRWQFQTIDPKGNLLYGASGVFAEFVQDQKITRTFEAENGPFSVQLEYLVFEKLPGERSKLTLQSIYKSVALRDQMLKLPFAQGLNMAHDRLQKLFTKLN